MQYSDQFATIAVAREAIKAFALEQEESYKTVASNKKRYIIACDDKDCDFEIRAYQPRNQTAPITIFKLLPGYACLLLLIVDILALNTICSC